AAAQVQALQDNLEREQSRTQDQLTRTQDQAETYTSRLGELQTRQQALRPQIIADETGQAQQQFLDQIAAAEELTITTGDAFAVADQNAKNLQADLRKVEQESQDLREKRAVIQATVGALQNEQTRIATDIEERFSTSPAALETTVMTEWPEGAPSVNKARAERDFLNRERDAMGPVNLRAQVELDEIETSFGQMETEKGELTEAIARLREGIDKLNVEARERITTTFAAVDAHFRDLFKRLFGGGDAYLKLIDSEDPLEAGLEIFAQPPGKHLQSLTLLSGGEQTLTALAMIFAMFLSNPAPVCVLDEVDAPLDDANVDRVCTLLEEMSTMCDTRFLVITHHRMTMARMARLYGVTMAERGVSQLVSVNLAMQGDLLATTHTQAA
ncbi:MAG TPA: chromosome segregation protein SMC, partial [Alphaproteobacteria bacterium]